MLQTNDSWALQSSRFQLQVHSPYHLYTKRCGPSIRGTVCAHVTEEASHPRRLRIGEKKDSGLWLQEIMVQQKAIPPRSHLLPWPFTFQHIRLQSFQPQSLWITNLDCSVKQPRWKMWTSTLQNTHQNPDLWYETFHTPTWRLWPVAGKETLQFIRQDLRCPQQHPDGLKTWRTRP